MKRGRGRRAYLVAALTLCAVASACVSDEAPLEVPSLDRDRYETEVQPFVAASCAGLDCHGDSGRPLRLYSELGLRRADELRVRAVSDGQEPEPLTTLELDDNVAAFAALQPKVNPGDEQIALSKPLSEAAGGGHHVGGDLFDNREHPGYLCLSRWFSGASGDEDSCALALDRLSR